MNIKPFHLLPDMLAYARPYDSPMEQLFCDKYIGVLPGVEQDTFGNYYVEVGSNPTTLFSAHTDTVDYVEGFKRILLDEARNELFTDNGSCLGADDTTGIWIMRLMIMKQIPGMYVFHRGEEVGCLGSGWLAANRPDWLKNYDHAIAFDRAGNRDIITSQRGSVCASKGFATDFAARMYTTGFITGAAHKPASGVYTDTAEYTHLIPECTNLSVGYEDQHTPSETQCIETLKELVPALLTMNWAGLSSQREPVARKTYSYASSSAWSSYGWDDDDEDVYNTTEHGAKLPRPPARIADYHDLLSFVMDYPEEAAQLLQDFDVTDEDMDYMLDLASRQDPVGAANDDYRGLTHANH